MRTQDLSACSYHQANRSISRWSLTSPLRQVMGAKNSPPPDLNQLLGLKLCEPPKGTRPVATPLLEGVHFGPAHVITPYPPGQESIRVWVPPINQFWKRPRPLQMTSSVPARKWWPPNRLEWTQVKVKLNWLVHFSMRFCGQGEKHWWRW